VPEGEGPDCKQKNDAAQETDKTDAAQATDKTEESQAAEVRKPARRFGSKTARSRSLPAFLRRVDLFLSQGH